CMRLMPRFRGAGQRPGYERNAIGVNALGLILLTLLLTTFGQGSAIAKPVRILAFGTSLTQGYNLPPGTEFTAVLQARLQKAGFDAVVVNAGVSGDTSADGLARLDWVFGDPQAFDAAIVELGSN